MLFEEGPPLQSAACLLWQQFPCLALHTQNVRQLAPKGGNVPSAIRIDSICLPRPAHGEPKDRATRNYDGEERYDVGQQAETAGDREDSLRGGRQGKVESAAIAQFTLGPNPSAVGIDQLPGDSETKPGAATSPGT